MWSPRGLGGNYGGQGTGAAMGEVAAPATQRNFKLTLLEVACNVGEVPGVAIETEEV